MSESLLTLPDNPFTRRLVQEVTDIMTRNPSITSEDSDLIIGVRTNSGANHVHYPASEHTAQLLVSDMLDFLKMQPAPSNITQLPQQLDVNGDGEITPEEKAIYLDRKIVFHHGRALGDGLMFTAGIRDFKILFPYIRINVDSNQDILWENNPHLDKTVRVGDPGVEYYSVGYPMGDINRSYRHFTGMFLFDMIAQADEHMPLIASDGTRFSLWRFCAAFGSGDVGDPSVAEAEKKGKPNPNAKEPFISVRKEYRNLSDKGFAHQCGDLHMTEKERQTNIVKDFYGVDKYWVVGPGGKRDCTCKIWDWRKFQEVVNYFEGIIKFVVVGRSDHLVEKLTGVVNLVDKFNSDVRGLIPLVYHAEGVVAGVSFLNHLAAAIPSKVNKQRKPCVVLWGGREPSGWCYYTNHQVLHTNGSFSCCGDGGCWKARVKPIPKDPEHNSSLCKTPVNVDGKHIAGCMHSITPEDVIRAIERYYDGDIYSLNTEKRVKQITVPAKVKRNENTSNKEKKINILGNLTTDGGGEQSMCKIAEVLDKAGWDVHLYPWDSIHQRFKDNKFLKPYSFKTGMLEQKMRTDVPLLFYGNDSVWDFPKHGKSIVDKVTDLIVGINFMNGDFPKCKWLQESGKLRGVVFQSSEKKDEFIKDAFGYSGVAYYVIAGAIDLQPMLEVCTPERKDGDPFVILKHGKADERKYVTEKTKGRGKKVHVWQENFAKDPDTKFYKRLLKDTKDTRFEFMSAPGELVRFFKDEPRMVFHEWNSMSVTDFLSRGHAYLDHLSNDWRHQYPRTIGEALAAGLPVLCEPRDGPLDRVLYGDTGFFCVDYDEYKEAIRKLQRKEKARQRMGRYAKDWARDNLRPENWVEVIEELVLV